MIGIIDYRMGNLRSVQKAFEHVGASTAILSSPRSLGQIDRLVLPGVGAFVDGMAHLRQAGWPDAIGGFIDSGRPFLGICLGMQLLFDHSAENEGSHETVVAGLSILPGQVVRFENRTDSGQRRKVPHMGWNALDWTREDPILNRLSPGDAVYFVHGYHVVCGGPQASTLVSATADYGGAFCASIWQNNIWATQFHPEKSQQVGLQILRNFASF